MEKSCWHGRTQEGLCLTGKDNRGQPRQRPPACLVCHPTIEADTLHYPYVILEALQPAQQRTNNTGSIRFTKTSSVAPIFNFFSSQEAKVSPDSMIPLAGDYWRIATGFEIRGGPLPETSLESAPIPGRHYRPRTDYDDRPPLGQPLVSPSRV